MKSSVLALSALPLLLGVGTASADPVCPWVLTASSAPVKLSERDVQVSRLVRTIQDQIELEPDLEGVIVVTGELRDRSPQAGSELVLAGKMADREQSQRIEELAGKLIEADDYCIDNQILTSKVSLSVRPPSPALASRYFRYGIDAFNHQDYATADVAFMRALAEAPGHRVSRYWRVLTAMLLGQTDRANRNLELLLLQDPGGSESHEIATSLERIQGPIRWQLMELERQALLSLDSRPAAPSEQE